MHNVLRSLKNACIGLQYCFKTQRNMAIHALVGIVVVAAGIILRVSLSGMLFLLTAIASVLVAEAFNTALEKTIDLYTVKRNHIAQTAKDVAAGAVLLTSVYAVITGLIVLGPPLWLLIWRF
jgi:diacylglycerol kinase